MLTGMDAYRPARTSLGPASSCRAPNVVGPKMGLAQAIPGTAQGGSAAGLDTRLGDQLLEEVLAATGEDLKTPGPASAKRWVWS